MVALRTGWQLVPEDNIDHRFAGDAVLLNDKLEVILRDQGRGAEVYSKGPRGLERRIAISHAGVDSAMGQPLDALKIFENNSGAVMVEASFKDAKPAALRFRLTTGESILEIRPGEGAAFVTVESKTRYVIVPDFFGDDLVYGAESFTGRGLPAENFWLSLLDGGDAIVMTVCQSSEQRVWLDEAKSQASGADERICSTRIDCIKDKSIWLAFLESPGIWRAANAPDKTEPPFPAKWRCSFVRANGVADSWDAGGSIPDQAMGLHKGPLITYPIDRVSSTPLTAVCPTDVMRNTLGVGPCQYILAVEGLSAEGDPTPNNVMNWVEREFEQNKETKAADDIKARLEQMSEHVAEAHARIERYAEFADQIRSQLTDKPGAEPFVSIIDDLDRFVAAGQTPAASPESARELAAEVAALIGKEDALLACQRLGEPLRSIGAIQDGALARCRTAVRRLREESRTIAVKQSRDAALAQEVEGRAHEMLQKSER
ncbi:MAG: hypothetical protein NTW86_15315 [Candidatus Sumerlaeota bacterium]|nr:hypothetical protein [Candidatus Sumerlaeota bacterium]